MNKEHLFCKMLNYFIFQSPTNTDYPLSNFGPGTQKYGERKKFMEKHVFDFFFKLSFAKYTIEMFVKNDYLSMSRS